MKKDITIQDIIEHLKIAGMLETRIWEFDNLINKLTQSIEVLKTKRGVQQEMYNSLINWKWLLVFPIAWVIISLGLIFSHETHPIMAILLVYYSILPHLKTAAIIALILTIIPLLISLIVNTLINMSKNNHHNQEIRVRDAEYNENLKKAEILNMEKQDLIQKKNQAKQYLLQVYSADILFPKYRNMIAVLTMQEYFISGRCEQLTGHEGAYNIYENELRQNTIINSLDAIYYSLEQIKQNQFMLYQAIEDSNRQIDRLSYAFQNVSSSLASLNNNAAVSAYNSKIAADNTKVLSYIELLKM